MTTYALVLLLGAFLGWHFKARQYPEGADALLKSLKDKERDQKAQEAAKRFSELLDKKKE